MQTVPATLEPTTQPLEPLERLSIRDQLQDLWRAKVENITTLAVQFHANDSDTDEVEDLATLPRRLADLRLDLTEIEAAMRRMDVGQYGRCEGCAALIPYDQLRGQPDRRQCASCEPAYRGGNRRV